MDANSLIEDEDEVIRKELEKTEITDIIFIVQTVHETREMFKEKTKSTVKFEALKIEKKKWINREQRKKIVKKTLEEVGQHFDNRKTFIREMIYKYATKELYEEVKGLKRKHKESKRVYLREKFGCEMCIFSKEKLKA